MVVINIKKEEKFLFTLETNTTVTISDIIEKVRTFLNKKLSLEAISNELPDDNVPEIVLSTMEEALNCNIDEIDNNLMNVKGALMIAYPEGVPNNLMELFQVEEYLSDSTLWWAGKELNKEKSLADYIGKNEKQKIIAKIQKKGSGAPVREPPLDEEGQKALMAYYYKKQEENKKLMENTDDDYIYSAWADGSNMKKSFHGISDDMKWKVFK
jgi:hypothetical protein